MFVYSYGSYCETRQENEIRRIERIWIDSNVNKYSYLQQFNGNYGAIIIDFGVQYPKSNFRQLVDFFDIFHTNVRWLEIIFDVEQNITSPIQFEDHIAKQFVSDYCNFINDTWQTNILYQTFMDKNVSFDTFLAIYDCHDKKLPQINTFSVNIHGIGRCNMLIAMINNNKLMKLLNLHNSVKDLTLLFLNSNHLYDIQLFVPCIYRLLEELKELTCVTVTIHLDDSVSNFAMKRYFYNAFLVSLLINCVCHSNIQTLIVRCGYAGAIEWDTHKIQVSIHDKEQLLMQNKAQLKKNLLDVAKESSKEFTKLWCDIDKHRLMCNRSLSLKQIFTFDRGFML